MTFSRSNRSLVIALVAALVPAVAVAQAPGAAPADPANQEMQALFMEMQQVHQQLEQVQIEALADPELNAQQESLGAEIQLAMAEADPMLEQRMARLEEVMVEGRAAEQAGDTAKRDELGQEFQQIQQHFMSVQQSVVSEPPLAEKVEEFQSDLEATMIRMNPEAESLISRLREIEIEMERIMSGN
ncbi:MAG: hypothetical protein WD766_06625 [Gemmatimonadota bacterium]